ncbi:hypothetical protein MATL_G00127970 [Megalops atlanticus]|uniref:Vitamin K-dependent protein C n=1 Tax=Megalops atlanticus TaxID=7932 RepID=A0A9D3PZM7_MEGAT|nr:hypothetical protein MATL_G00127970 [Megalops atlanticus]
MSWIYPIIWLLCACDCWSTVIPRRSIMPVLHGELESPLYPRPYPDSLSEQWYLSVPAGYQLQLTFTHLDVEPSADCYYDSVTVMYEQKVLGKFCGQENSAEGRHPGRQPILSPGNHLRVIFHTDDSNAGPHQHIGFSAFYQAIDIDECSLPDPDDGSGPLCSQICHNTLGSYLCSCRHGYELRPDQRTCILHCGGGLYTEAEGVLTSPGYPLPSPLGMSCQYHISVELGFTVTLNFTEPFHIEDTGPDDSNCLHHWLQVSIPEREPMRLCGDESPGVIPTQSNSVQLEYRTDSTGLSRGWKVHYTTQRVQCESPGKISNGKVTPSFPQYLYRDYIHVRCDTGYKLMMGGKEIQSYFSVCQSDGQWLIPLPECHLIDCGDPSPLLNGGVSFLSGTKNQYHSVIEYHCNEPFYSLVDGVSVNYTCAADRKWKDHRNNYIIPKCFPVCGHPTASTMKLQRILGGATAPAGAFPWQVFLHTGSRGGAAVVGDQWLLTAAHNLFDGRSNSLIPMDRVKAYVGDIDIQKLLRFQPLSIASLHPHPNYNSKEISYNHDIALIKLQQPITFNHNVMPLCLPPKGAKYTTGTVGFVSGFGLTESDTISNILKYLRLPLVDHTVCGASIDSQRKLSSDVPSLTDNMFCAGFPEGGRDTCSGDSGGAFALRENDQYWAAGIVSWGINCGVQGTYGIYTRVENYVDWIKKTMEQN